MSFTRSRCARALAVGTLSAALLSAGTAGAFAANDKPSPTPSMTASGKPSMKPSHKPAPMPTAMTASISLTAKPMSVKTGQPVVFAGRTKGLKVGSPLLLQHLKNGKWTALGATGKVKTGSSFAISTSFKTKGTEKVRVASVTRSGKVISNTVTVTVS